MNRPSWDEIWLRFCKDISRRSVDEKIKVGAVIVSKDNTQVLAVGYNGDQKGGKNCRRSLDQGQSGFIHAEVNALIKMDYNNPKQKKMYLTHSPCEVCAKCIVNAGIDEVVFMETYDESTVCILTEAGITVRKLNLE